MTDSAEFCIVGRFDDKFTADMAAEYFTDFHLWSDRKGEVKELEVTKFFGGGTEVKWCCVLPKSCDRYTTTLRDMTSGLSDFMKGYRLASRQFGARMDSHLAECTPDMVGDPINTAPDSEPKYWVERVTKAGKITLSPKKPSSTCKSCGYDTMPGARYCAYCR